VAEGLAKNNIIGRETRKRSIARKRILSSSSKSMPYLLDSSDEKKNHEEDKELINKEK
jgi:hypothetical protein